MKLSFVDVCPRTCFIHNDIDLSTEINKLQEGLINNIQVPVQIKGYDIYYSPVGNYTQNPTVIISGKTPSFTTQQQFINRLKTKQSFYEACFSTIYANMRDNLFKYLSRIGLFDYLAMKNPEWKEDYRRKWNQLFNDSNFNSGIQLTQSCNCAIFNNDASGLGKSSEPKSSAFMQIQKECGCLFSHFRISDNTRLIIFLDTPFSGNKFHPELLWKELYQKKYPSVRVISITHPSNQNQIVYSNLDNIYNMPDNNKKDSAIKLFNNAKRVIKELMEEV